MMNKDYKEDFPIFQNRKDLIYFDNAATALKPQVVIDAVGHYYQNLTANPHRGAYQLSSDATAAYEEARQTVAGFIGAESDEVVFTAGTTESINMAALALGFRGLEPGDEILITIAEHHSNLLPWQRLAKQQGVKLRYLYTDENGTIPTGQWQEKINQRTRIMALFYTSNVLGTTLPLKEMIQYAHQYGTTVLVDAAQGAPHRKIDVKELDVDLLAFSGHKLMGPSGIGVLYGRRELLEQLEPANLGGGIVEAVTKYGVTYLDAPHKFEAGTPNVEGAIGLKAAIEYLEQIGFTIINEIEQRLTKYALKRMQEIPGLTIYGDPANYDRSGIIAFNLKEIHPHDVASILDSYQVAIRAGHHCAHPLMTYMGEYSTCRMSLYFYNTEAEIDQMITALQRVREVLGNVS